MGQPVMEVLKSNVFVIVNHKETNMIFVFFGSKWVFPKIGVLYPKMDGENNRKPY